MNWQEKLREPLWAWLAGAIGLVVAVVGGSLLFTQRIYEGVIWRYFWGPVVADAHGVSTSGCAVRDGGDVTVHATADQCAAATGVVAHPGYTTISTISYALVLIFAIAGVVLLMQRMEIGTDQSLFFALIPFVFLGGILRVVEDANAVLFRETGEMLIGLPWAGLIISPLIYFFVFLLAATSLLACLWLDARGALRRYEPAFAGIGMVAVLTTFGIIGYFLVGTEIMSVAPLAAVIPLGGATLITGVVWWLTQRFWPEVNAGTGLMGAVIVWGHAVDGVANVLSLDWAAEIGLARTYEPKHVVNDAIQEVTASLQPGWVTDAIGAAWPFLPVKVLVAVVVVWVFNDEVFEESPNFSMLMLVAILAVGLGPGTRDFLRATLGI